MRVAEDNHVRSLANNAALSSRVDEMADPFRHLLNSIAERIGRDKGDPFLRKIDPRLHLHQQAQQTLANLAEFFGQPSSQLLQCHSHAGF